MVLKEKFSVVETSKFNRVKDLYLLPLQRSEQPDDVLLPFDGPGLPNPRSEMIMAIIVRRRDRIEHVENGSDETH
uniref:Uncharacterized protein n=1 Tax=Romanomermis culicivorax TaxID=13658 RepID=A0A915JJ43_ROMCU